MNHTNLTPALGRFVVPEIVSTHFHFKAGDAVADFGAGTGFYLRILSDMVGTTGRVFACEIQRQLVEKLSDTVRLQGLSNITPLWCDLEESGGIKLRNGVLDGAIMVNTFFQIDDKGACLRELRRVLRTGGTFQLIDWTESFGGLGPQPLQVVTKAAATDYFESAGFLLERDYPAGDHHYGLAFRAV